MIPASRIQAVIQLLAGIAPAWRGEDTRPADAVISTYFKSRRYIGAKDKGAISTLFYAILRHKRSLEWWCDRVALPPSPRSLTIAALSLIDGLPRTDIRGLFTDGKYVEPELISPEEKALEKLDTWRREASENPLRHPDMPADVLYNVQAWIYPLLEDSLPSPLEPELLALMREASVDLRVNTRLTTRDELLALLKEEGFDPEPTPLSPVGLRLKKRGAIFNSPAFKQGFFEIQDEGSQLVSLLVDAKPGEKVIDFCAGAGGKTLALCDQMNNKGRLLAWDTSEIRLNQIKVRLKRARADNVQLHVLESEHDKFLKRHIDTADRVLVDAPCTGSGTWRRNPDLKWRTQPEALDRLVILQQNILSNASRLVKKGGVLIYVTCSLLKSENLQQVDKFLGGNPNFLVEPPVNLWNKTASRDVKKDLPFLQLTPHQDGTDGFFAARLKRTA